MAYSAWFGRLARNGGRATAKHGLAAMRDSLARQAEQRHASRRSSRPYWLRPKLKPARVTWLIARSIEALAASEGTGLHWYDAETHRIRGEILLKQDPSDPAPAEEAFLTAIAIAQRQKGARSFELRAALRSQNSTNRPTATPTRMPSLRPR